eukprot:14710446-Ditylum_brightwellii.AAC.1
MHSLSDPQQPLLGPDVYITGTRLHLCKLCYRMQCSDISASEDVWGVSPNPNLPYKDGKSLDS